MHDKWSPRNAARVLVFVIQCNEVTFTRFFLYLCQWQKVRNWLSNQSIWGRSKKYNVKVHAIKWLTLGDHNWRMWLRKSCGYADQMPYDFWEAAPQWTIIQFSATDNNSLKQHTCIEQALYMNFRWNQIGLHQRTLSLNVVL